MENFVSYLTGLAKEFGCPLRRSCVALLEFNMAPVILKKDQYLLQTGQLSTKFYFVKSGSLKYFSCRNGKNSPEEIIPKGNVTVARNSLYNNDHCDNLVALEDSEIEYMFSSSFDSMSAVFPEFRLVLWYLLLRTAVDVRQLFRYRDFK